MATSLTSLEISLVLPPNDGPVDFDAMNCDVLGTDIHLVQDSELGTKPVNVIEVNGAETRIIFYPDCSRPYLVMHLRSMKRFMSFQITCLDDSGRTRSFQASNKQSVVTIDDDICKMPIQIEGGWQYVCLDLEDMMANAFGCTLSRCTELCITGSCRVAKIFFQSMKYADIELPDYLRVVNL